MPKPEPLVPRHRDRNEKTARNGRQSQAGTNRRLGGTATGHRQNDAGHGAGATSATPRRRTGGPRQNDERSPAKQNDAGFRKNATRSAPGSSRTTWGSPKSPESDRGAKLHKVAHNRGATAQQGTPEGRPEVNRGARPEAQRPRPTGHDRSPQFKHTRPKKTRGNRNRPAKIPHGTRNPGTTGPEYN